MSALRTALEQLLRLGLAAARGLFLLQGVAFACAWAAAAVGAPADAPAWLREAALAALAASVVFALAGLLLGSRLAASDAKPTAWLALLWLAAAALALHSGSDLLPLWIEIGTQLDALGPFTELGRGGSAAGLVLLPILLALLVPALVSAAVLAGVVGPAAVLGLLATRSRLLAPLLAKSALCQLALAAGAGLAATGFARVTEPALAAMAASGDAEVLAVAERLRHASALLVSLSRQLLVAACVMLGSVAVLRPRRLRAAAAPPPERSGVAPSHPAASVPARSESAPAPRAAGQREARPPFPATSPRGVRLALLALGAAMLLFAAADVLRSRASYAGSEPAPGQVLGEAPALLRLRFGAGLDAASSASLTRLVTGPADGRQPEPIEVVFRTPDSDERTLEASLPALAPGVYRVAWSALPAGGGVARRGSFSFGVGMAVPPDEPGLAHSLVDRDAGTRGRRHTWAGGLLLLACGALLPRRRLG